MRTQAAGYHLGSDRFSQEMGLETPFLSKNPLMGRVLRGRRKPCMPDNGRKAPEMNKTGRVGQEKDQFLMIDRPKDKGEGGCWRLEVMMEFTLSSEDKQRKKQHLTPELSSSGPHVPLGINT